MKRSVPALAPLLPLLIGCNITIGGLDDDGDDEADSGDGDGDTNTSTGDGDGDGDGDTTDDEIGTDTDSGSETEGPLEICLSEGPDEPWFALEQYGQPLVADGPLEIECGGQGSFMFRIDAQLGGFTPADDLLVPFHVKLDVEGYNIAPNNVFFEGDFNLYVGCCDDPYEYSFYCYYGSYITMFPPDGIEDLSVLNTLPGTLTVTMTTPDGDVEQVVPVELWAMSDETWEFCEYGYGSGIEPAPHDHLAIPVD